MGKGSGRRRLPALAAVRPARGAPGKVLLPERIVPGQAFSYEVSSPLCAQHGRDRRSVPGLHLLLGPGQKDLYVLIDDQVSSPADMAEGAWCSGPECHLVAVGEALLDRTPPSFLHGPSPGATNGAIFWEQTGGWDRGQVLLAIRLDAERGIAAGSVPTGRTAARVDLGQADRSCSCPLGHLATCFHRDLLARVPVTETLAADLAVAAANDTVRVDGVTKRGTLMSEVLVTTLTVGAGLYVRARLEPPVEGLSALRYYIRTGQRGALEGDIDEGAILMEDGRAVACEACADDGCVDLRLAQALLEAKARGAPRAPGTETFDENHRLIQGR